MESIDFRPCLSPVCSRSINAIGQSVNSQTPLACMRTDQIDATLCVRPEQSIPRKNGPREATELRKLALNESPRMKFSLAHCSSPQLGNLLHSDMTPTEPPPSKHCRFVSGGDRNLQLVALRDVPRSTIKYLRWSRRKLFLVSPQPAERQGHHLRISLEAISPSSRCLQRCSSSSLWLMLARALSERCRVEYAHAR
jgi:hypothetical protein